METCPICDDDMYRWEVGLDCGATCRQCLRTVCCFSTICQFCTSNDRKEVETLVSKHLLPDLAEIVSKYEYRSSSYLLCQYIENHDKYFINYCYQCLPDLTGFFDK